MIKKILIVLLLCWCNLAHTQSLNYYYGNIHAHTSYSDGNKDSVTSLMTTPIQDFLYAKQSLHTDFYGISEHNHQSAGIKSPIYFNKGLADANAATIDGQFVAMYGMEWGVISSGGHVIIYGFDSLCGWDFNNEILVNEADYTKLWQTINRKNRSFAYLAHPQSDDYENIFNLPVNAIADSAIVGMAMRSGPAFSTNNTYSNPATSTYIARYNDGLKRGYHLGVGLDHDTHNSVFDRQSNGRLVVMAPILNRGEIIEAMRRMRFYSSDDWNAEVNFVVNNLPMGSVITNSGNPTINVAINDADGETISSISVYYGVPGNGVAPTQLTSISNSSLLTYTHNIANNDNYYYYLAVTQADGDKIWSSPIWYKRNDNITIQTPIANFSNSTVACSNYNYTLQDSSLNSPTNWWWVMPGANPTTSSLQNPLVTYAVPGTYNVTLTVTNQAGTSSGITKTITVIASPIISIIGNQSICKGQQTTLTAQGTNTFLWNNGSSDSAITVQPSLTTQYVVTGYDFYCHDTAIVNVIVTQTITTPFITENGSTLVSNYPTGNQWFMNNTPIPGATQNILQVTQPGIYRLQVTDSAGCVSDLSALYNFTLNIKDINTDFPFIIYPNPSNGTLYYSAKKMQHKVTFLLLNAYGNCVYKEFKDECLLNAATMLQFKGISKGIYLLKIVIDGINFSSKISIE